MSALEGGEPTESANVSLHLSEAHRYLHLALLHLAVIEEKTDEADLLHSRRMIASSIERIRSSYDSLNS